MDFCKQNSINVINGLIKNCTNVENILRNACRNIEDKSLHKIFLYYADLCKTYIIQLKKEILRLKGNVEDFFQEVIPFNSGRTSYSGILEICENAVNTAVKKYKEIYLREDILGEVVPIISRQYFGVVEAHQTIKHIYSELAAAV
jgi:hypothetical protein